MKYDCNNCNNKGNCEEAGRNGEFVKCIYEPAESEAHTAEFKEFCEKLIEKTNEVDDRHNEIEYIIRLNLQYIDKIAHTKDISKKKAIRYIKEHLKASTRSFVKWGDDNDNNNSAE